MNAASLHLYGAEVIYAHMGEWQQIRWHPILWKVGHLLFSSSSLHHLHKTHLLRIILAKSLAQGIQYCWWSMESMWPLPEWRTCSWMWNKISLEMWESLARIVKVFSSVGMAALLNLPPTLTLLQTSVWTWQFGPLVSLLNSDMILDQFAKTGFLA